MKPTPLPVNLAGIPDVLKTEARWCCWKYIQQEHRWPKVPHQISGHYAKANDPTTWTTFENALAAYETGAFDGIGFCLGDGWAGIDLDDAIAHGQAHIGRLPCYHEVSPSEKVGRLGPVPSFIDTNDPRAYTCEPVYAKLDDDALVKAILASLQAEKFAMLVRGDMSAYDNDHSRADQALCSMLAYWCQNDTDQIDRLFRQTKLMRDKWNTPSYRRATLRKAVQS